MMSLNTDNLSNFQPLQNGFNYGGSAAIPITTTALPQATSISTPTEIFDISVLTGLKPSDKYLGRNKVSDIQEVYQSYLANNPIGRGGKYITDAAKKYGVSFTEAARGYLLGAGLNIIPSATTNQVTDTNTNTNTNTNANVTTKNPFDILADAFSKAFGNAVYNPPLQQQTYGYTPADLSTPVAQGGSSGFGIYIILAVVGIVGYFLYKRFAS